MTRTVAMAGATGMLRFRHDSVADGQATPGASDNAPTEPFLLLQLQSGFLRTGAVRARSSRGWP